MGKGQDAKKSTKKEAAMTPKEKKAAKRLKKAKQFLKRHLKLIHNNLVGIQLFFFKYAKMTLSLKTPNNPNEAQ